MLHQNLTSTIPALEGAQVGVLGGALEDCPTDMEIYVCVMKNQSITKKMDED
jgi:hypothetical protein